MAMDLTRGGKRVAMALGLVVVVIAAAMPAIAANAEPKAATRTEVTALSFDVVNGRWNFTGRNVMLKDAVRELAAKAPVDIRIQDVALETSKLGIAFKDADPKQGMAFVLGGFNYSEFDDPKTGRRVYLVTSLATEVKPTPEARTVVATAAPKQATTPSPATSGKVAKSLNEFRAVEPAQIKSREQSQAEIDADYKREHEEKLLRAVDALRSKDATGPVQVQALADVSASTDPRATAVLKEAWTQVQGMPNVAPQVARSAWQHAAQMQFANADANALLVSMTSSTIPGVRDVAQAATLDMERYRAAQKPR